MSNYVYYITEVNKMKSIGIVRRIDELGRIVVPKEIRRTMRIESGDEMEIYVTDDEKIVLGKYSSMESREQAVVDCCNALAEDTRSKVLITDRHHVVAESGVTCAREMISKTFLDTIQRNGDMILRGKDRIRIRENGIDGYQYQGIFAVNRNGILHGAVVVESDSDIREDVADKAKLISRVISENIGEY